MTPNVITINDLVSLAQFVSELARQGVVFQVWSEDITDGQCNVVSTAWHVTLTGGF
jgi:hypothetical protein